MGRTVPVAAIWEHVKPADTLPGTVFAPVDGNGAAWLAPHATSVAGSREMVAALTREPGARRFLRGVVAGQDSLVTLAPVAANLSVLAVVTGESLAADARAMRWVILGVFLLRGRQSALGGMAMLGGILMLVSAFNGSKSKVRQLGEIEQQYAAVASEIDQHRVIVNG